MDMAIRICFHSIVDGIKGGNVPKTVEKCLADQLSRVFGQYWSKERIFAVRSSAVGRANFFHFSLP